MSAPTISTSKQEVEEIAIFDAPPTTPEAVETMLTWAETAERGDNTDVQTAIALGWSQIEVRHSVMGMEPDYLRDTNFATTTKYSKSITPYSGTTYGVNGDATRWMEALGKQGLHMGIARTEAGWTCCIIGASGVALPHSWAYGPSDRLAFCRCILKAFFRGWLVPFHLESAQRPEEGK